MTPQIAELIGKIRGLEGELDAELAKRRADLRIGIEHGRVAFEAELLRRHRELRQKLLPYLFGADPLVVLTAPVIYAGIIPFLLLDLFVSVFQAVCFPIYGIAKVKRAHTPGGCRIASDDDKLPATGERSWLSSYTTRRNRPAASGFASC